MTADAAPSMAALAREYGLKDDEYDLIVRRLNREPNPLELGVFSVMWSEHCSYKSSRKHLAKFPTKGPRVIQGPGENAGVIDIGDGQAAVFKMESHNHPSFIEPYQGAATGVGGIMRDVFTMGARPIALLDALRFGDPAHPKTRRLVAGVVAGIGGYGNCVGVPTVGGETNFDHGYDGNILVNAMCVGLADADKIFYSAAPGAGLPVVYFGSKTGRDGIHGATMASASFEADSEEKRPTVQVGDPFAEKLLIEATLELMASGAVAAIQDMGAAGLTSSSVEMAGKGGVGITLDLDKVPQREEAMSAYEMMLSESQERMLAILKPGREADGRRIFEKWGLDAAVIGQTTDTGHIVLRHRGEVVCDLPLSPLTDDAPLYDRPWVAPAPPKRLTPAEVPPPADYAAAVLDLMSCPDMASKRWLWEQYDRHVMADTLAASDTGHDAAIVRVHGSRKALALTSDVTPRYVAADPYEGGKQAVAEAWRNLTAVGAAADRHHRQPQLRQSGAAGDHGPAGARHRRHGRGLPRARLPGRERQRLALQRDRRDRHPAHAHRRRRRADRGLRPPRRLRGPEGRRCARPPRRDPRRARRQPLSARAAWPPRRRAAARGPCAGAQGRRLRARADRLGRGEGRARPVGRRACRRGGRNGAGGGRWRGAERHLARARPLLPVRRRPGPLPARDRGSARR